MRYWYAPFKQYNYHSLALPPKNMYLNLLVIRTAQAAQLAQFYTELGLEFTYHRHGKGVWHYSTTLSSGLVFEIYPLQAEQLIADKSLRLGFAVQNLDTLIQSLKAKNVQIITLPKLSEWGYCTVIEDLDGRKVELKQTEE